MRYLEICFVRAAMTVVQCRLSMYVYSSSVQLWCVRARGLSLTL